MRRGRRRGHRVDCERQCRRRTRQTYLRRRGQVQDPAATGERVPPRTQLPKTDTVQSAWRDLALSRKPLCVEPAAYCSDLPRQWYLLEKRLISVNCGWVRWCIWIKAIAKCSAFGREVWAVGKCA